ncbi:peptidoglycan DD-metalloendopeptidase family protein [uncultured Cohaesibacter sp.]|uniref:peptidoglycan DD-metalloendopeptidase family protein n=1 Tax=uncultured Cohaesibacter sp. TaxID=1002546 RepID=UPI0029C759A0|nr:peptidoglycan DD-metalloendopeptidase family protein [uncultured Cohaesibacter sp.]
MPNAVASAPKPVYVTPQPTYNNPQTVYVNPQPVPNAPQQVAAIQNPSPVLLTNSINKSATPIPVSSQPMPPLPTQAQMKQQGVDYTATGSINSNTTYQPSVISRFDSLPKNGPRAKQYGVRQTVAQVPNYAQQSPVNVPLSDKASQSNNGFSLSKLLSREKSAPKTQQVDYTPTGSITPPAAIPTTNRVAVYTPGQQQVASAAPMPLQASQEARTSGQWTSIGGTMVTVLPGDDINTLSQRYGVPAKAIADVNGLPDQSFVASGQRILIPVYQQERLESYPVRQQVASLNASTNSAVPSVVRVPKANPLRLQSQTPYAQQVTRMQQSANAEGRHMVMAGETLGGIASRYGVSVSDLAQANGLSTSSHVRMGQRLHIPQAGTASGIDYTSTASINQQPSYRVPVSSPAAAQPSMQLTKVPQSKPRQLVQQTVQQIQRQPSQAVASLPKAKSRNQVASVRQAVGIPDPVASDANQQVQPVATSNPSATENPKFRWPVRGRIISSYGRKTDGSRNDGINLSVPAGTSVRVAESGTVIYSGDKLKGYGNLVLVQHSNGWVTAYAHNEKVLVSKGQQVRRGQIIAQAGKSGNVEAPQLHFELRIKGDPVDPVPYLVSS